MLKVKVTIPITDDGVGNCSLGYYVRYKKETDSDYKVLLPSPITTPIEIPLLDPATYYTVEVTRHCCDGTMSNPVTTKFVTPES